MFFLFRSLLQPPSPLSKNRDTSPPPSPQPASLQRQDSGPRGIKGILKKSRSTSVESDHSESSMPESTLVRQSSITLSHPESDEEMEEDEKENETDEDADGQNERDTESLSEDATDGASFSIDRQRTRGSCSSSSSGGSFEEIRSPSPDESLEQTSTVSEDVEELESSLDESQGSSLEQRSVDVHKHSVRHDEVTTLTFDC